MGNNNHTMRYSIWLWSAILIICLWVIWHQGRNVELFSQSLFASSRDMEVIVRDSPYFKRMNDRDLFARGAFSPNNYRQLYMRGLREFTDQERATLSELIERIDIRLGTRTQRLHAIPWKFAKVATDVERGWPHTLQDVIVLSSDFFATKNDIDSQMETLLHEKIHIYQRSNPDMVKRLIMDDWGFEKVDMPESVSVLTRNNPDIEGFYSFKGLTYAQFYTHQRPTSIAVSQPMSFSSTSPLSADLSGLPYPSYVQQREHPYEAMAIMVARLLLYGNAATDFEKRTLQWCTQSL